MRPPAPDHSCHVITIDGPAGAGKSTVAGMLAKRLGWFHLDSGSTYRAFAAAVLRRGVSPDDAQALAALAGDIRVEIREEDGATRVLADGEDVTELIRTPEVSRASSPVSAVPEVRARLVELQRSIAEGRNTVAEGRDMGTVVFPNATLKVFLTASPQERARRRVRDFQKQNQSVSEEQVLAEILERDARDSTRAVSPLQPAPDAYILETDQLTPDEVVDRIVAWYVDATL
ncbi:MAG: cytidylate kinase [Armatimonadota bacterium]|nr:MAG: cytidylate kinase [Armatimonadota bacterium]